MKQVRAFFPAVALAICLSACQAVQGSGPHMANASSVIPEALPYDVIDLTPQTVIPYRPEGPPLSVPVPVPSAPTHFVVGPDDVLTVHIVERYVGGVFATLQQGGTVVVTRRVPPEGTINVPFAGGVPVIGKDVRQIEAEILARLAGKANEPQVIVELSADRTNIVRVSGAVSKPGPLSMLDGTRTVTEAINRAGGPMYPTGPQGPKSQPFTATSLTPTGAGGLGGYGLSTGTINRASITPEVKTLSDASQMRVVIHRAGTVVLDKPYSEILAGGDVTIQKGDEIVVSPNSQVVTILGAVQRSGNLPIVKQNMTLADALGEASGLSDVASNRTGVYIFRSPDAGNNRGRIFRLDLLQPVSVFVAQQFAMHPRDVLYVTNAPLYEFDKTLTPLYRTLVVLRTGRQY